MGTARRAIADRTGASVCRCSGLGARGLLDGWLRIYQNNWQHDVRWIPRRPTWQVMCLLVSFMISLTIASSVVRAIPAARWWRRVQPARWKSLALFRGAAVAQESHCRGFTLASSTTSTGSTKSWRRNVCANRRRVIERISLKTSWTKMKFKLRHLASAC